MGLSCWDVSELRPFLVALFVSLVKSIKKGVLRQATDASCVAAACAPFALFARMATDCLVRCYCHCCIQVNNVNCVGGLVICHPCSAALCLCMVLLHAYVYVLKVLTSHGHARAYVYHVCVYVTAYVYHVCVYVTDDAGDGLRAETRLLLF